jgi:hypothetical protein
LHQVIYIVKLLKEKNKIRYYYGEPVYRFLEVHMKRHLNVTPPKIGKFPHVLPSLSSVISTWLSEKEKSAGLIRFNQATPKTSIIDHINGYKNGVSK